MANSNYADSVYSPKLPADVYPDGTPNLAPIHPGEILALDLMEPLGVTAYQLHKATGLTENHIGQIIHGKRGITAATALRLAAYFGTSPTLWTNLQSNYEIRRASSRIGEQVAHIVAHPRAEVAAAGIA